MIRPLRMAKRHRYLMIVANCCIANTRQTFNASTTASTVHLRPCAFGITVRHEVRQRRPHQSTVFTLTTRVGVRLSNQL